MSNEIKTTDLVEWVELAAACGIEEVRFVLEAHTHEDSDAMVDFFRKLHGMCMDGNVVRSLSTRFDNKVTSDGYFNHVDVQIGLIGYGKSNA
jgi:hypothetical protein